LSREEPGVFYTWQIDDPESRMPPSRRFPPSWTIEDIGAAFVVEDGSGQKLVYVYYKEERQVRLFDAEFIEC
jgi:hypothetical protein